MRNLEPSGCPMHKQNTQGTPAPTAPLVVWIQGGGRAVQNSKSWGQSFVCQCQAEVAQPAPSWPRGRAYCLYFPLAASPGPARGLPLWARVRGSSSHSCPGTWMEAQEDSTGSQPRVLLPAPNTDVQHAPRPQGPWEAGVHPARSTNWISTGLSFVFKFLLLKKKKSGADTWRLECFKQSWRGATKQGPLARTRADHTAPTA